MTKAELQAENRSLKRQLTTSNRALTRFQERILPTGRQMANCCWNMGAGSALDLRGREIMGGLSRQWDKAVKNA